MSRRIFISSVIQDFAAERAAAKEAVISLRQQPVMAEDFGAQPFSSQTACMEGVKSSEIYIGIFGPRYGYKAPGSGLAATEEEFNEARRRGLPILCFEQKSNRKEAEQTAFLKRIKAYETGYAFAFFKTPDELKMQVVQAIHDLIGQPGISTLDPAGAVAALNRHAWGSRRLGQYETWLGAVLVPARQGDCFLDVLEFGQKELRNRLLQPALFGPEALLSVELGVRTAEEENALVFRPYAQRGNLPSVEDIIEGGVALWPGLGRLRVLRHWGGLIDMCMDGSPIIDRTPVGGLYLNGGWCYGGFKATPASGWCFAHMIARDEPHALNAAFRLDRFAAGMVIDEKGQGAQPNLH